MNILYEVTEILASFVEVFIIISMLMYVAKLTGTRQKYIIGKLCASCVLCICVLIMNQIHLYSLLTVAVSYLISVLLGLLIVKRNGLMLATAAAVMMLVIHLIDFIIVLVIGLFYKDIAYVLEVMTASNIQRCLMLFASKSIDVLLYYLFRKALRQMAALKQKYLLLLLLIAGGSYVLMTYLFYTVVENNPAKMQAAVVFSWFYILVFMFAAVWLSVSITKTQTEKQINETLQVMNHSMMLNYDKLDADRRKNHKQMHDHNKHLLTLSSLVKSESYREMNSYLDSLILRYSEMPNLCNSGERVIDAIINSKIAEAQERGIQFTYNARFFTPTDISQVDICAILANQIDNAFEAVEKLEKTRRKVHVAVWQKNQFAFFKVSNIVRDNPMKKNKQLYSTKIGRQGKPGFGLRSIYETAQKYNGTLQNTYEGGRFVSVVSLCFHTMSTKNSTI